MKKISIIGCGWLGLPLSESLKKEHEVECFSRVDTKEDSPFWQADTLIISINTKDNYLNTLQSIAERAKPSAYIILMSSTSVYREFDTEVDENSIIKDIKLQREAELFLDEVRENILILRLGGLMGDDRISGKWKSISTFSDGPVNYIHKQDVINITKRFIELEKKGVFNLVAPLHPLRSEIHKKNCEKFGFELSSFEGKTKRVVISDKLVKELNYKFIYPDPLEFWN